MNRNRPDERRRLQIDEIRRRQEAANQRDPAWFVREFLPSLHAEIGNADDSQL